MLFFRRKNDPLDVLLAKAERQSRINLAYFLTAAGLLLAVLIVAVKVM